MHILLVDNDPFTCQNLLESIKTIYPKGSISFFTDPLLSIKHGINNPVDLLIITDNLKSVTGLDVIRILKNHHPNLKSIFITDYSKNFIFNNEVVPNSIIQKPVTPYKLNEALKSILLIKPKTSKEF